MLTTSQLYAIKPRGNKKNTSEILALTHQALVHRRRQRLQEIEVEEDKKQAEDEEFTHIDSEGEEELSCVICIGSTGAGKSATISKCTRRPVSSGNGKDRVTIRCAKYDLRPDAKQDLEELGVDPNIIDLLWVDTVGWDDADLQGNTHSKIMAWTSKNHPSR